MKLYRIQDANGRGPFQPGLSRLWVEPRGNRDHFPPVYEAFPNFMEIVKSAHAKKQSIGCACQTLEKLNEWFSPVEQMRLQSAGFRVVEFTADHILSETPDQVLFASNKPLRFL